MKGERGRKGGADPWCPPPRSWPPSPNAAQITVTVNDDDYLCVPPDCSGHGTCTKFVNPPPTAQPTDGYCACDPDWFGPDCNQTCTRTANGLCDGHGVCELNTLGRAVCRCALSDATGYWGGDSCSECAPSFFGDACKSSCPGCNGHGYCNPAPSPTTPMCYCDPGFWGNRCEQVCDAPRASVGRFVWREVSTPPF